MYLTAGADDCGEPAVSPDGTRLAVICTSDTQTAKLEVIPLANGRGRGSARARQLLPVRLTGMVGRMAASLLYLAPADATGHFQLWWLNRADTAAPSPPKQVTNHLDFDATSPPAWAP